MRPTRPLARIAATALLSFAAIGCGGEPPPPFPADADGTRLGLAAGDVSQAFEDALGAASIVSEAGLSSGGAAAASSIGWLLGACATAKGMPAPAKGVEIGFGKDGCGVPTTRLFFRGALAGQLAENSGAIAVKYTALAIGSRTLDGAVTLVQTSPLKYRLTITGLTITDGDRSVVLDATGTAVITTDHITFSANGTFADGDRRYVFEADDVSRSFISDCYPETGTLTIVDSNADNQNPLSASLRYDPGEYKLVSSLSGIVSLWYRDVPGTFSLRKRDCQ